MVQADSRIPSESGSSETGSGDATSESDAAPSDEEAGSTESGAGGFTDSGSSTFTASLKEGYELSYTLTTSLTGSGTLKGEDGSGTYTFGSGTKSAFDYNAQLTLGADGEFALQSGSGSTTDRDWSSSTFNYSGSWSDSDSSGTYNVFASSDDDFTLTTTFTVVAGAWVIEGEGSYNDSAEAGFNFSAEGTYTDTVGGGTVTGTWTQSGGDKVGYEISIEWVLVPDSGDGGSGDGGSGDGGSGYSWDMVSGESTDEVNSYFNATYEGSGTYTREDSSSAGDSYTISGTIEENGGGGYDFSSTLTVDLVTASFLETIDYSENSRSSLTYDGSGTITRGDMTGTVTENGLSKTNSNFAIHSELTDAMADPEFSGGGSSSIVDNSSFSITMAGPYSIGSLTGTASFDEGHTTESSIDITFSINKEGEVELDSLLIGIESTQWLDESFSVSGTLTRGTLSGSASESAAKGFNSSFAMSLGEESDDGPTEFSSIAYSTYDRARATHDLTGPKTVQHPGGTLTGQEHDFANIGHDLSYSVSYFVDHGDETNSGRLASLSDSLSDVGYSVSGPITGGDDSSGSGGGGGGGGLTGTASEYENSRVTSDSRVIFVMDNSGQWDLEEAIVTLDTLAKIGKSQNLSGPYTSGQLVGTQSESSHSDFTITTNLIGIGTPTGGGGSGGGDSGGGDSGGGDSGGADSSDSAGEDSSAGDSITIDDDGTTGTESHEDQQDSDPFSLDWDFTGTGDTALRAGAEGSKNASGPISAGFLSGLGTENSEYTATITRDTVLEYQQPPEDSPSESQSGKGSGGWETVSGTGSFIVTALGDSSESLSGVDTSGSIDMTISTNHNGDYTYNQTINETYSPANDDWDKVGTQSTLINYQGGDSASGTGTYTGWGGLSMTMTVNNSTTYGGGSTEEKELDPEDQWQRTAATNRFETDITNKETDSGSGSYTTFGAGVLLSGTRSVDSGNELKVGVHRQGTWSPSGGSADTGGTWTYIGGGTASGGTHNGSSTDAKGNWTTTYPTDPSGGGGGTISGIMEVADSRDAASDYAIVYEITSEGRFEIVDGTVSITNGSGYGAMSDAHGLFYPSGFSAGMIAYDEDMNAKGETNTLIILAMDSTGSWQMDTGTLDGSGTTFYLRTLVGSGTWSRSVGDAMEGMTMSGLATMNDNTSSDSDTGFQYEHTGSDWDSENWSYSNSGHAVARTSSGNGTFWHPVDDLSITGAMTEMSSSGTGSSQSHSYRSENGVALVDEVHFRSAQNAQSENTTNGGDNRAWSYSVGRVNIHGDEMVFEARSSSSETSTETLVDIVMGDRTQRTHEVWNSDSNATYQYNWTEHATRNFTDTTATEIIEGQGFRHTDLTSNRQSDTLSVGTRTTVIGPAGGESITGSGTVNNTISGGGSWIENSRSYDKTTHLAITEEVAPGVTETTTPETWELEEETQAASGNLIWTRNFTQSSDFASGITTGGPSQSVSGGSSILVKRREAKKDSTGKKTDTGLQVYLEESDTADDDDIGKSGGKNTDLKNQPKQNIEGGPEGDEKGKTLLEEAAFHLGGMLASAAEAATNIIENAVGTLGSLAQSATKSATDGITGSEEKGKESIRDASAKVGQAAPTQLPDDYEYPELENPWWSTITDFLGGTARGIGDDVFNAVSGAGDDASFGLSSAIRSHGPFEDRADKESTSYKAGAWVGFVAGLINVARTLPSIGKSVGKLFTREAIEEGVEKTVKEGIDDVGTAIAKNADDATKVTAAAQSKGAKFFKQFSKGDPASKTTRQIGKYTEFAIDVAGDNGTSFTRWVKVVGPDGKTIRLYHDTFENTGKFLNRGIKVPGPTRHVK